MKTILLTLLIFCSLYSIGQGIEIRFEGEMTYQVVNDDYELFWGQDESFLIHLNDSEYLKQMTIATAENRYHILVDKSKQVPYYIVQEVKGRLLWIWGKNEYLQFPSDTFEL